jgi:hypothetical protein
MPQSRCLQLQLLHPLFQLQLLRRIQAALVETVSSGMVFVPTFFFVVRSGDIVGQVLHIALQLLRLQLLPYRRLLRQLAALVAMAPSGTAFVPIPFIAVRNGDIVGQVRRTAL